MTLTQGDLARRFNLTKQRVSQLVVWSGGSIKTAQELIIDLVEDRARCVWLGLAQDGDKGKPPYAMADMLEVLRETPLDWHTVAAINQALDAPYRTQANSMLRKLERLGLAERDADQKPVRWRAR